MAFRDPESLRITEGFLARHPWIVNTVATLLILAFAVVDQLSAWAAPRWTWLALPMGVGTLLSVAGVWLRHRWPVATALGLALVFPLLRLASTGLLKDPVIPLDLTDEALATVTQDLRLSFGPGLAGLLALFAVAAQRRARVTWSVLAVWVLVRVAGHLLWVPREDIGFSLVPAIAIDVIAVLLGINMRTRRRHIEALARSNEQLALERDMRAQLAVTAERTRIAREMHDVVAHSLGVMITLADGATAMLERHPDQARRALEEIGSVGRASLADTRRLVGVLRDSGHSGEGSGPSPLTPQPTAQDIDGLLQRFRRAGLPVTYRFEGEPLPDDALLHLTVYRIVQEGLTNVLRHSPGTPRIDVAVVHRRRAVAITVDNETGTQEPTMAGSKRGLIGIRERAATFSGTVDAGPSPDGWHLRVLLRLQ